MGQQSRDCIRAWTTSILIWAFLRGGLGQLGSSAGKTSARTLGGVLGTSGELEVSVDDGVTAGGVLGGSCMVQGNADSFVVAQFVASVAFVVLLVACCLLLCRLRRH